MVSQSVSGVTTSRCFVFGIQFKYIIVLVVYKTRLFYFKMENAMILLYDICRLCLDEPGMDNIFKPVDMSQDIFTFTGVKVMYNLQAGFVSPVDVQDSQCPHCLCLLST